MPTYNKIKPTRPLGSSSRGGFVRFMKKLDNPDRKELKDDYADLLSTKKVLGRELYQRYEKLLEWIAGECNWSDYVRWVFLLSNTERQACSFLRWDVLNIGNHTVDSMGMYNGDRSSTLRKAVERILSDHQGQQQDDVSPRASGERLNSRSTYFDLERIERLYDLYYGPSAYTSRSR